MVTLILVVIFGIYFWTQHKKMTSGYVYFVMLLFMTFPPTISDKSIHDSWFHQVENYSNIIIFAICLCVGYLPWKSFDKYLYNHRFVVPDRVVPILKIIFTTLILLSLYSIIYLLPIAFISVSLGADQVRNMLYTNEYNLLPKSPLTTIAVAAAALNIYCILFFFISCLNSKLKSYRFWLIISSFSYMINCLAITARDGLILLPLFYVLFFLVFRQSLNWKLEEKIKSRIKLIVIIAGIFMIVFSLSRFAGKDDDIQWDSVYSGTFGYITQQPYVFDATIEGQDDFWGFECRFPLINRILGIPEYEVNRRDHSFEWSFGTMYAEHYSAFGWAGLIGITLSYVFYYTLSIAWLRRCRQIFGLLLMFTVYAFIALSGMFYTRIGANLSMNVFYLILSFIPFVVPNLVQSANK